MNIVLPSEDEMVRRLMRVQEDKRLERDLYRPLAQRLREEGSTTSVSRLIQLTMAQIFALRFDLLSLFQALPTQTVRNWVYALLDKNDDDARREATYYITTFLWIV